MVRISDDIKLDFKDVLIRPKRSTLRSRSQVSRRWATLSLKTSKKLAICCSQSQSRAMLMPTNLIS